MTMDKYPGMLIIIVIIMHECCYSCLVYLFTGQSRQNLAPPVTPDLLGDYKAVTSMC